MDVIFDLIICPKLAQIAHALGDKKLAAIADRLAELKPKIVPGGDSTPDGRRAFQERSKLRDKARAILAKRGVDVEFVRALPPIPAKIAGEAR